MLWLVRFKLYPNGWLRFPDIHAAQRTCNVGYFGEVGDGRETGIGENTYHTPLDEKMKDEINVEAYHGFSFVQKIKWSDPK